MVAAIVILYLLVILLGVGLAVTYEDSCYAHGRIEVLEQRLAQQARRVDAVAREVKTSHTELAEGLWERAAAEVDREIEQARARGRQD